MVEGGLDRIAQACRALNLPRSGYYRVKRVSPSSRKMNKQIVKMSRKYPRYGYRRITALLRRESRRINAKRVARVRRAEKGCKCAQAAAPDTQARAIPGATKCGAGTS